MPLILEDNLFFIHIPKSGGTSVEDFLKSKGKVLSLRTSRKDLINGHSAQHMTFREVQNFGFDINKISFFTIVRDPLERTISEYFWLKKNNIKKYSDFNYFIENFLNKKNSSEFDNHNLSSYDFLINNKNIIDPRIKIFKFFDYKSISELLGLSGLEKFKSNVSKRENIIITEDQKSKIKKYFEIDYKYFKF